MWLGLALAAAVTPPPVPSAAVAALATLTVLTLVSALWGQAGESLRVAPLPGLYTGLLYAAEWSGPRLLPALRVAIVAVAAAGIAGRATGLAAPSPEPGSIRMAWPVTYANGLGLVCAFGVLLCLGLRPRRQLGAAVCAVALVWTFSRSALVALLLGFAVLFGGALWRRRPRWALGVAAAALVAAAVAAGPLVSAFRTPAPDTRDAQRLLTVSGHGRTLLWSAAWHEGAAHPVAGGGAGTWERSALASTGRLNIPADAHSLELETFAELGALGVAALACFFWAVGRRRGQPAALAVVAAWAAVAAVDWDWQLPAATAPALLAAGALTAGRRRLRPRGALAVAVASLVVGAAAALHMLGAIQLARGHGTSLLPWDARPWVRLDPARACRIDPGAPALARAGVRCREDASTLRPRSPTP